jgi:hypothetical protein
VHRLYGKQPASLGTLFTGIKLGAPAGSFQPESAQRAIADITHDDTTIHISFESNRATLNAVVVQIEGACSELGTQLAAAWSPALDHVWLDPATRQRARFDPLVCTLRFDQYTDVASWIDQTTTAVVPLALIGTPAQKLRDRLGARIIDDEAQGELPKDPVMRRMVSPTALLGSLSWEDVGVGPGSADGTPKTTFITTFTDRGKIVGLEVSTSADQATGDAIRDRLTMLLGATPVPPRPDEGMFVWKTKPIVQLDLDGRRFDEHSRSARFRLEVGTQRTAYGH